MAAARAHVLVVDDAPDVRTIVRKALERDGYTVETASDAEEALEAFGRRLPDVVVLDVAMPDRDGLDVLRTIRRTSDTFVILVSARDTEADRVAGLEVGADDYVIKPFFPRELSARVGAVLRRGSKAEPEPAAEAPQEHHLTIDLDARVVLVDDVVVRLTPREFDLLAKLANSPRKVLSRARLMSEVWGTLWQDPSTVTEHVRRVRHKIEHAGGTSPITTVRGIGYRYDP